jgi:hypothetical protein
VPSPAGQCTGRAIFRWIGERSFASATPLADGCSPMTGGGAGGCTTTFVGDHTTMSRYHRSADDVPDGLRIPRWSWASSVNGWSAYAATCLLGGFLSRTRRLLGQGGAVDQHQFINFVRQRGLAVIATRGPDGAPPAALVGITATLAASLELQSGTIIESRVSQQALRCAIFPPRAGVTL